MAYELKRLRRQKIRYNDDDDVNLLFYQLVVDGAKVTPTSATVTIYRKGNTTALLTAQAMTLSGTILTYAIDTTTVASWPIESGYRAEFSVTYDSDVYLRHEIFDVVRWLLDLSVGVDQLIDIDDSVAGTEHNDDDDIAGLIVAVRSIMQMRIEAKVVNDKKLIENMILDESHLAICACFYILGQLAFIRGNLEKYEKYKADFEENFIAVLGGIRYDEDQDGNESSEVGGIQEVRLTT